MNSGVVPRLQTTHLSFNAEGLFAQFLVRLHVGLLAQDEQQVYRVEAQEGHERQKHAAETRKSATFKKARLD